jgi:pSer/pThr/pTyr-binding forkhead associated (FHA) protein
MITIIVSLRGRVITTQSFTQERIRIGRSPDNEVRIDNAALSRQHAIIEQVGRVHTLIDVSQKNGVYLNGERVKRKHLNHGDSIALGKFVLTIDLAHRSTIGSPIARSAEGGGRTIEVAPTPAVPRPTGEPIVGHLRLPGGDHVIDRDVTVIGGAAECHLRPSGLLVPGRLALLLRGHGGFSLLDAGRGGVSVNDDPIRGRVWLRDGDRLALRGLQATFHLGLPARALRREVIA